ncbi:PXPV repeat protein [Burkholderia metallica]
MNKRQVAGLIGGIALLASGSAMAGHVDLSVGIGVPVAPVYVEPAPVYVAPQPAVVAYPGYGYGYDGDDDDDRYWKWRKHQYKQWRKHHRGDDDD